MTQFDDDLDDMFSDLPTAVIVFGELTGTAFQDAWDADGLAGTSSRVVTGQRAVSFPTARFPDLAIGNALTVDGVPYTVIDRKRPQDAVDGDVTHVLLQAVA